MMTLPPKISIIVPVYKVEQYLPKCIESILAQTFQDWELLLVDDGSPDTSGKICDGYALKDSRIKVFHKVNGGVSSARNLGIDNAKGEWITFIDSDDYIQPSFLEGLYAPIAQGEEVDFVHGGCVNVINEEFVSINQSYDYYVGDDKNILFQKLRGLSVSKLFRLKNIIYWADGQTLYFDEKMKIAEDMAFTLDYALYVSRFALVPEKGYCYRKDNMQSATKSNKVEIYETALHSFKHLYKSTTTYILKCNISNEIANIRLMHLAYQLQNVCLSLYYNKYSRIDRIKYLKSDMNREYLLLLSKRNIGFKSRVFSLLINGHYYLFDMVMYLITFIKKIFNLFNNVLALS